MLSRPVSFSLFHVPDVTALDDGLGGGLLDANVGLEAGNLEIGEPFFALVQAAGILRENLEEHSGHARASRGRNRRGRKRPSRPDSRNKCHPGSAAAPSYPSRRAGTACPAIGRKASPEIGGDDIVLFAGPGHRVHDAAEVFVLGLGAQLAFEILLDGDQFGGMGSVLIEAEGSIGGRRPSRRKRAAAATNSTGQPPRRTIATWAKDRNI